MDDVRKDLRGEPPRGKAGEVEGEGISPVAQPVTGAPPPTEPAPEPARAPHDEGAMHHVTRTEGPGSPGGLGLQGRAHALGGSDASFLKSDGQARARPGSRDDVGEGAPGAASDEGRSDREERAGPDSVKGGETTRRREPGNP